MKKVIAVMVLAAACLNLFAQKKQYNGLPSLVWPKLYDVKFVKATDQNGEYDKPIFSDAAKSLNGKTITLPGYIVPFICYLIIIYFGVSGYKVRIHEKPVELV